MPQVPWRRIGGSSSPSLLGALALPSCLQKMPQIRHLLSVFLCRRSICTYLYLFNQNNSFCYVIVMLYGSRNVCKRDIFVIPHCIGLFQVTSPRHWIKFHWRNIRNLMQLQKCFIGYVYVWIAWLIQIENVTAVISLTPRNAQVTVPVHSLWFLCFYASSSAYIQMQHKVKVVILTL